jgi:hypothetical protein
MCHLERGHICETLFFFDNECYVDASGSFQNQSIAYRKGLLSKVLHHRATALPISRDIIQVDGFAVFDCVPDTIVSVSSSIKVFAASILQNTEYAQKVVERHT